MTEKPPTRPIDELHDAFVAWDTRLRQAWNRSLPFPEAMTDRWERAASLGFGSESSIYNLSCVYGDVEVGEHTWIGPYTILDGSGGLVIGDWCSISAGVHLYSHSTVRWAVSTGSAPYERAKTQIGDACFIGPHAVVAAGITVGSHCVVGAQAYVNRDLPANSIAGGVPAKIIGKVCEGPDGVELNYA